MTEKNIVVDPHKCRQDDLCIDICPGNYLHRQDEGFPVMKEALAENCMSCGHCVMVCPTGALSHSDMTVADTEPLKKELEVTLEQAQHLLKSRRSIRNFKKKPVSRDLINSLINNARHAPSGCNTQMVKWTVVTDKERLHQLAETCIDGLRHFTAQHPDGDYLTVGYVYEIIEAWENGEDQVLWNAPVLITASSPQAAPCENIDLIIALSHIDLVAPVYKLGTCWTGTFSDMIRYWEPLGQALGLTGPNSDPYFYSMILGFPKYRYHCYPKRNKHNITWI